MNILADSRLRYPWLNIPARYQSCQRGRPLTNLVANPIKCLKTIPSKHACDSNTSICVCACVCTAASELSDSNKICATFPKLVGCLTRYFMVSHLPGDSIFQYSTAQCATLLHNRYSGKFNFNSASYILFSRRKRWRERERETEGSAIKWKWIISEIYW